MKRYAGIVGAGMLPGPGGRVGISMTDTRDISRAATAVTTEDGHDPGGTR